jgi:AcrR family transcriptional regulator
MPRRATEPAAAGLSAREASASAKTKFELKREDTYRQLLEAGMRELFEKGYSGTRAADIAAATGHTTGAFYFHFKNKEDFFLHVLRHRERLRAGWQDTVLELDPATPLDEVVVRTLRDLRERMQGMSPWTPVMVDFHFHAKDDREMRETLRAVYERWLREIETFVDALKAGGWVAGDRDSRELAVQLLSFVEGTATHAAVYGGVDETAVVSGCVRLLGGEGGGEPTGRRGRRGETRRRST